jgi:dihydrofolate reductase
MATTITTVRSILAMTPQGVIGQGNFIPWNHSGDLKRFFQLTKGNALLIGAKTLLGIASHYAPQGKELLGGRNLIVVGSPKAQVRGHKSEALVSEIIEKVESFGRLLSKDRIYGVIPGLSKLKSQDGTNEAEAELLDAYHWAQSKDPSSLLYVAGGNSVYERYLPYSAEIDLTIIIPTQKFIDSDLVYLNQRARDSILGKGPEDWACTPHGSEESSNNSCRAVYMNLRRV